MGSPSVCRRLRQISPVLLLAAAAGCIGDVGHLEDEPTPVGVLPVESPHLEAFPRTFGLLVGSALLDGTLVVADRVEVLVAAVDFDEGVVTRIGLEGLGGPGEYRMVEGLFRFLGDTIAVRADRTWLLFVKDGWRFVRTERPTWLGMAARIEGAPNGSGVYVSGNPGGAPLDQVGQHVVVRMTGLNRFDTIAAVRIAETREVSVDTDRGRAVFRRTQPFSHRDYWAPGPSGELVIGRSLDSSIDVLIGNSRLNHRLTVEPVPIWPEEQEEPDPRFVWDWPESKPVFGAGSPVFDEAGREVWIGINENVRLPTRDYLILDIEQGPLRIVRFPIGFRLLRVGGGLGYGTITDPATGLVEIFRFPTGEND